MKSRLFALLRKARVADQALHPVERRMAKHYIKTRLLRVFPELRNDPQALENAYRSLSLEARESSTPGEPPASYEVVLPL